MEDICGAPDSPPPKTTQKILQPPGGASTDIFGSGDSASDTGSENGEAEPVKKVYRLKSSFVLGDEQPETPKPKILKKKSAPAINPVTGECVAVEKLVAEPPKPAAGQVQPGAPRRSFHRILVEHAIVVLKPFFLHVKDVMSILILSAAIKKIDKLS